MHPRRIFLRTALFALGLHNITRLLAEKLTVALRYGFVCLDVAGEEALCLVSNYSSSVFHASDLLKIIRAVDVPALEQSYADSVLRAEHGASHTHQTMVTEARHAVSTDGDIFRRAVFDAEPAGGALAAVDAVKEGIDVAADELKLDEKRHDAVYKAVFFNVRDAVGQLFYEDVGEEVVYFEHFPDKSVIKPEVYVVRENEMVLVFNARAVMAELADNADARSVVGMVGLAGILVDEGTDAGREVLAADELQEGPRRIEAVYRVSETDDVITGEVKHIAPHRVYLKSIDRVSRRCKAVAQHGGQITGIVCARII